MCYLNEQTKRKENPNSVSTFRSATTTNQCHKTRSEPQNYMQERRETKHKIGHNTDLGHIYTYLYTYMYTVIQYIFTHIGHILWGSGGGCSMAPRGDGAALGPLGGRQPTPLPPSNCDQYVQIPSCFFRDKFSVV